MAFDSDTRNKLARMVTQARQLLTDEFTQQLQELYGIQPDGTITAIGKLTHLDDEQVATAKLLRERIEHLVSGMETEKEPVVTAIDRTIREQAFTILNRFAALRMCEERGLVEECVRGGMQSKGFKVYEKVSGVGLGDIYERYMTFLFCLFDEIAVDLGILFDRFSPYGLLFPREKPLLELFTTINNGKLREIWGEDETIGWIYQYFNPPEERRAMREASTTPRNSRELAVRNQFFTPRYVVEFLIDNTLGRIWLEMRKGETALIENCRFLVRRPNEVFLNPCENSLVTDDSNKDLTDEEMLKQTLHKKHRPMKDPRDLKILDPACGSGHFLLYAYDLLDTIYTEAWQDSDSPRSESTGRSLRDDYSTINELRQAVPELILRWNLHGIDIDPRAVQIAALALWLRAQQTWHKQDLKTTERPRIAKCNIVCAEPMPGEEDMLQEFSGTLKPSILSQLVEAVFQKMKLAGEAGSLLKIEEEIQEVLAEAKKQWLESSQFEQSDLFPDLAESRTQQRSLFDVKALTDEDFWDQAEERILNALREYAVHMADRSMVGLGRMFTEDAARGFAFIDLCQKRYDVVVMNPPFGALSEASEQYVRSKFPLSKADIFATFVEEGIARLVHRGYLGAITNRTGFYLKSFETWRREIVMKKAPAFLLADLGHGVLDAMVETAAYCLARDAKSPAATFFRMIDSDDKEEVLRGAASGENDYGPLTFILDSQVFTQIPSSPFCYWATEAQIAAYAEYSNLNKYGSQAFVGFSTKDDFRFLRLAWEPDPKRICASSATKYGSNSRHDYEEKTYTDHPWVFTAKGGEYSPFFGDIHLLVNWKQKGAELHQYVAQKYPYLKGNTGWVLHPEACYFEGGVTWTRRTTSRPSFRILPTGCMFTEKGPTLQVRSHREAYERLGVLQSEAAEGLIELQLAAADAAARSYEIGIIESLPIPKTLAGNLEIDLSKHVQQIVAQILSASVVEEPSQFFSLHWVDATSTLSEIADSLTRKRSETRRRYAEAVSVINALVAKEYGFGHKESSCDEHPGLADIDHAELCYRILQMLVGTAFGRWDIRYVTGEKDPPKLPDAFDPLPICPPGMLQNDAGFPAESKDVPDTYPMSISWNGVLVDDPEHPGDIVRRVQEALTTIWVDRADVVEQETCQILKIKSVRDYFRNPNKFFAEHLKRYSKSRRKAPMYWPLSTSSGSYTLWIYYHRLTDQTLYACVNDYVSPKLDNVSKDIKRLQEEVAKRATAKNRQRLEGLTDFEQELKDFRDELLRVAGLPYKPNLNDGAMITAAPLWQLFRHNQWRKSLEACWKKLEAGEYDWAHLSCAIWPDRVKEKCKTDLSTAIAHDLEELYEGDVAKQKKSREKT